MTRLVRAASPLQQRQKKVQEGISQPRRCPMSAAFCSDKGQESSLPARRCAAKLRYPHSAPGKGKRHCRAQMLLFIELCLPVTHLLLPLRHAFSSQNTSMVFFLYQPQFFQVKAILKLIHKINA